MPQVQETLASYRTRVLRALRDSQQSFFNAGQAAGTTASYTDLDAWINQAVRFRDFWSGGSRSMRSAVPLTVGLDQYDLTALFPNDTVLDIITLWLIWGNNRIELREKPISEVTAGWRQQIGRTNVPAVWCRYGATGLFVATAPGSAYSADFDVSVLSGTLTLPGDVDPLPYPYTEPVVPYAAYLAKEEGQRQYQEADVFYNRAVGALRDIEGARVGSMPKLTRQDRG